MNFAWVGFVAALLIFSIFWKFIMNYEKSRNFGNLGLSYLFYVILMRLFLASGLVVFETNNSLSEFLICSVNIIENAGVFFLLKYCLHKCSIDWQKIWCYFRNWGQIPQNLGFHLWKYMSLCFRFRENGQSNNGKIETILWRLELKKERLKDILVLLIIKKIYWITRVAS